MLALCQSDTPQLEIASFLFGTAVRETRIAQTCPDGQNAPALDVLHKWNFAQTLHNRVIV